MARHTHNTLFFNEINPLSCYWAGFIAADGCVRKDRPQLIFGLAACDFDQLNHFKNIIQSTKNVQYYNASTNGTIRPYCKFSISNAQRIILDLKQKFNIGSCKSLTLEPPNLNNEDDIRAFIRGYMDGDGSICISSQQKQILSFVGTKSLLEWIKNNIKSFVLDVGDPTINPNRTIYQLCFGGNKQTKKILDWIYKDSTPETRLCRKYQKYLDICQIHREVLLWK